MTANAFNFDRSTFVADIKSKYDSIREHYLTDSDADSKIFTYMVADMYESLDEDSFEYTDGPNDRGIDFAVRQGDNFTIYQCKSIELDKSPDGHTFDATPVNELREAIEFVLDDDKLLSGNEKVERFRDELQLCKTDHRSLAAVLAIQGRLSDPANEAFKKLKDDYQDQVDVILKDERSLYQYWHPVVEVDPSNIHIKLKVALSAEGKPALIRSKGWCCGIIQIGSFIDALSKYEYSLFELNVRSSLGRKKSTINQSIRDTISTDKGRKRFVHLNNGLVLVCQSYSISDDSSLITLNGAQVINGCQTLNTVFEYFKESSSEIKKAIRNDIQVIVKIIDKSTATKDGLLDEVIVTSNNQNPMNARNLKSNCSEQLDIQRAFFADPLKTPFRYFYIRKDGEFESFLSLNNKQRIPKKSWFRIDGTTRRGINKYRHVDNEQLAKIWWSWIGNSSSVSRGSIKFFEPNAKIYPFVFEKHPTQDYWDSFKEPSFVPPSASESDTDFDSGSPSAYQYLLAMAVSSYIEARVKPAGWRKKLRTDSIKRLKESGKIPPNGSRQDEDSALSGDFKYLSPLWQTNMTYVLTELAAFILDGKYGSLNSAYSHALIKLPDVAYWLEHGMDNGLVDSPQMNAPGGLMRIMSEKLV